MSIRRPKRAKVICYKNLIINFSKSDYFKKEIKTIHKALLELESELPKEEREFTNKLKKEKKENRMGCLCFFLVILLVFFFLFLNEAEMSLKEFFQQTLILIKGE